MMAELMKAIALLVVNTLCLVTFGTGESMYRGGVFVDW